MDSALSIPLTFFCALDTFLGKTSCLFFSHLSNLAVRNEFTELFLAHAQDIVGIITISSYFFSFMFSTLSESQYYCKI